MEVVEVADKVEGAGASRPLGLRGLHPEVPTRAQIEADEVKVVEESTKPSQPQVEVKHEKRQVADSKKVSTISDTEVSKKVDTPKGVVSKIRDKVSKKGDK